MTRSPDRPDWLPPAVSDEALSRAHAQYPALVLRGLLHATCKAVLVAGDYQGTEAVLKILTATEPVWRRHLDIEARTYQRFATDPPPVHVPRLLAPPAPGLLLVQRLPGHPVAATRYPGAVALPTLDAVLAAADALATWPGRTHFANDPRRSVLAASDLAVAADLGALSAVQAWARTFAATPAVFCHGDLLLTNVLATGTEVALVDWEYAGLRLPGYDHALLWLTLMDQPAAQARVLAHTAGQAAFRFNIASLLLRELRIHRDAAATFPQLADRYQALRRLADDVVFHDLPTSQGPCGATGRP